MTRLNLTPAGISGSAG